MNTGTVIAIVIALLAIGVAVWMYTQKQRTQQLKQKFGPEYDRVAASGDRRNAEAALAERQKRVEKFHIESLTREQKTAFHDAWQKEQAAFVDNPRNAVVKADALVGQVMKTRGYPVADFNQRADDLSVDHPRVVENYRIAHDIAVRDKNGEASTEDLRKAMVHYRALFEDLLGAAVTEREEVRR